MSPILGNDAMSPDAPKKNSIFKTEPRDVRKDVALLRAFSTANAKYIFLANVTFNILDLHHEECIQHRWKPVGPSV